MSAIGREMACEEVVVGDRVGVWRMGGESCDFRNLFSGRGLRANHKAKSDTHDLAAVIGSRGNCGEQRGPLPT